MTTLLTSTDTLTLLEEAERRGVLDELLQENPYVLDFLVHYHRLDPSDEAARRRDRLVAVMAVINQRLSCPRWCVYDDDMGDNVVVHHGAVLTATVGDTARAPAEPVSVHVRLVQTAHGGDLDGPLEVAVYGAGELRVDLQVDPEGARAVASALLTAVSEAAR